MQIIHDPLNGSMVQRFTTLDCPSGNPGSIPGRIADMYDDNFPRTPILCL